MVGGKSLIYDSLDFVAFPSTLDPDSDVNSFYIYALLKLSTSQNFT